MGFITTFFFPRILTQQLAQIKKGSKELQEVFFSIALIPEYNPSNLYSILGSNTAT